MSNIASPLNADNMCDSVIIEQLGRSAGSMAEIPVAISIFFKHGYI